MEITEDTIIAETIIDVAKMEVVTTMKIVIITRVVVTTIIIRIAEAAAEDTTIKDILVSIVDLHVMEI